MSVKAGSETPADADVVIDVAREMATVFGLSEVDIASWTAWNRRDVLGPDDPSHRAQIYIGGAMAVQCFYRTPDGERNKIKQVDDTRRPFSEPVTRLLGAIAREKPPTHCNSFTRQKL